MPPPGLQTYLWPRVTLTFDLLTPNLIVSQPRRVDHCCRLASKLVHWYVHKCGNRKTSVTLYVQLPDWPDSSIIIIYKTFTDKISMISSATTRQLAQQVKHERTVTKHNMYDMTHVTVTTHQSRLTTIDLQLTSSSSQWHTSPWQRIRVDSQWHTSPWQRIRVDSQWHTSPWQRIRVDSQRSIFAQHYHQSFTYLLTNH